MIAERCEGSVDKNNRVVANFMIVIFEVGQITLALIFLASFWKRIRWCFGRWKKRGQKVNFPVNLRCFEGVGRGVWKCIFPWIYPICVPQR